MSIVILVLVAAAISWLVYLGHGKVVRAMYRRRQEGDDPIQRAYAPELASVEQTAAVLHSAWFFFAFIAGIGYDSIPIALLVGIVFGVPIAVWESHRVKSILT